MIKSMVDPSWPLVTRDWRLFLAFGFGSGLSRWVPGTLGSLAAVPFAVLLHPLPLLWYLLVLLISAIIGIYLCGFAARRLGVHDHGGIVWDEFVGLWLTLICAPSDWRYWLAAFVLFRFFDMLKPWPINWLDRRVDGGFGIMLDDIVAGIMALAVLKLAVYWL